MLTLLSHLRLSARRLALPLLSPLILALPLSAQANDLEIHGSNTIGARLAPMLMTAYLQQSATGKVTERPNGKENEKLLLANANGKPVRVLVAAHGSSTGYKALAANRADIWASSRPAKDSEIGALKSRADLTAPDSEHVIAIDGLAVLVHPANPVNELSIDTLGKIFAGEIRNWSEIGGSDSPIHLYARDDRSGTWDTFKSLVLGKTYKLDASAKRFESNDQLSDSVSQDASAIGFAGLASVRDSKVLAISDGNAPALKPTQLTVASEDYPLARRLFMYSPGQKTQKMAADFLEFAQSEEGQAIVSRSGFISQNPMAVKPNFDDSVPASFQRLTANYSRLTVNFRFSKGRTKLDNKAQRDLKRVADYLSREHLTAGELLLIGFADQQSNELRAQMISELRALSVSKALKDHGIPEAAYTGYGQYMPVGTAGGNSGQQRNGRVEVWVRNH
ncbi:OmpA family protein [Marinobacter salinexigens]|uniref:OmpA family protein n=1 Tax=Marinobacter salinexigens TaxID=2919747 RepID=A0A5B0VLN5_9GAMM|nr:phosphate ABC transporter substrate-binding/OmpA family protein [Marinobacter salinexigens]KAA1175650.1 OmpA family protein [Marinobacter salinexigens]